MFRISKLADYGSLVMGHLAHEPTRYLSASEVAEALGLSKATVSKVLMLLAKPGLVTAMRGSSGGYLLGREPAMISLADIIEAIEGAPALTECSLVEGACEQAKTCSVKGNWQTINRAVYRMLEGVSLTQMAGSLDEKTITFMGASKT